MLLSQTIAQSAECSQGLVVCQDAYSQSLNQSCNPGSSPDGTDLIKSQDCACSVKKILDDW